MADDMVNNAALVRELARVRSSMRGDILSAVVTFECTTETCPCTVIRCTISEDRKGRTRAFSAPNRCVRCQQNLRFVGVQVGR